ncbi:HlyD family secretion protein [Reichenbachiella agarivorans]|uniref:HlyD family secretion protein n=1 Tax=Reichenbachiella agarivorans TaxID=2979464 RepID=A0ABY6CM68_9BACT|nr:HlyD family secretion protein [Reichenbachiella agarivorans]UXP31596.1 HlyD family secretion protein [Reichenbachiella agarivorans]
MRKKANWFYILIVLMLVSMLFISGRYFKGSGEASIGIAQTSEYKVKTEKSAMVKSINVVPGMEVKEGELLVELTSEALEVEIAKLTNRIAVHKSERAEQAKLAHAEISYIKAQNGISIEELDADILELESEIKMNKALTMEYALDEKSSENSPMAIKIKSLKQQKQKHLEALNIKIEDVKQESTTELQLLENQIILLESELNLLDTEKSKLNKYATASGVVKNVYVKPGEQVDSYTPLLEINPLHPTTVVAYLVGKKPTALGVGKEVSVSSYDQRRNSVHGKVIGYGSVNELPEILQKSTAIKAFGQQVFIEIPAENTFFNGEKVLIK